ncbi:hypothetical protein NBT05_01150 [Aquimarina sp. ERC-38]|uniref:hypothetical protein n=1 Tax=Aquimarina sp. ERC-38 TaxID=2949996 RepID=UPI0022476164|nr:hypothetical protein [Aquimarina sp. ERC-38]UZO81098.1 hypothetical protein NBT05_01150 [Aquimarina sp. ERC-38]
MKKLSMFFTALFFVSLVSVSCRDQKTAGEKVEDAVEDTGDAIEDAAEDAEDEIEDATDN